MRNLRRYVLQYRDSAGFEWENMRTFHRIGDALNARDRRLAHEEEWLPKGRHRVVDLEDGAIIEWRHEYVDHPPPTTRTDPDQ